MITHNPILFFCIFNCSDVWILRKIIIKVKAGVVMLIYIPLSKTSVGWLADGIIPIMNNSKEHTEDVRWRQKTPLNSRPSHGPGSSTAYGKPFPREDGPCSRLMGSNGMISESLFLGNLSWR